MNDFRLRRCDRIRYARDFREVFRHRLSVADSNLVLYAWRNATGHPRLGIVASRKVGNAVIRNRWKRILREIFRQHRDQLPQGLDLVFLPRRGASPVYRELEASMLRLARRIQRRLGDAV